MSHIMFKEGSGYLDAYFFMYTDLLLVNINLLLYAEVLDTNFPFKIFVRVYQFYIDHVRDIFECTSVIPLSLFTKTKISK